MNMKQAFVFLLVFFSAIHGHAQDFDRVKMDGLFAGIEENDQGMGSISIFKKGEEIYQKTFGYADKENEEPATGKTKYRIGSVSKTFTATVIMQLIDERKLKRKSPLSAFFPKIPNADSITVEHLLRHRSGLFNFTNAEDYPDWLDNPKSREELIELFIENGTIFEPDEKGEYSNTNYVLLSFIAEEVEGKPFSEILEKRIIDPLGLKNTYYGGKIGARQNEAFSYQYLEDWVLATETDMSIPVGAGAMVSTPTDLSTFFTALFTGDLVSEQSLTEMKKTVDGYGIGLFQVPFHEKSGYGHTGGIDGFQSSAAYFPEDSVAIAYLGNGVKFSVNNLLIGALSIYFGRDYQLPEFMPAIDVPSKELDKYLGTYSSPAFPLKLTITKRVDVLWGQGSGQPAFPMEAYAEHRFRFDTAGLKIDFVPNEDKLILKQGGREFTLTKE